MNRRTVMLSLAAAGAGATAIAFMGRLREPRALAAEPAGTDAVAQSDIDWLALTDADWRERLTPEQFRVLRREGTERPFTSPLNDEKRAGVYHCAGCDLPLFDASMKFDSGTGWPSFWDALPGALGTKIDRRLWTPRIEYHCIRCNGHQGHVFEDGPRPTGQRWCNNGVALTFRPAEA